MADAGFSDGSSDGEVADAGFNDGSLDGAMSDSGVVEGLSCSTTGADAQCVYLDSTMGELLFWQGCPAGQIGENCTGNVENKDQVDSVTYCENLNWGGFDDWELPNIDQLRSLIRGCAKNEYGSSECTTTHQCSYSVDNNCTQAANTCLGCGNGEGPGIEGCYLPADLPGGCPMDGHWSSSLQSIDGAYYLGFNGGSVLYGGPISGGNASSFRCVRSLP
jgi:hypothetical protein